MALKFYEKCGIYKTKQTSSVISYLKESVRKWTGGDENTGKQAGKEGKRMAKFFKDGLKPLIQIFLLRH